MRANDTSTHSPFECPPCRSGRRVAVVVAMLVALQACGGIAGRRAAEAGSARTQTPAAQELVLFSMSLLDAGYRFGGKNPEAGVDCSGMVSYVFRNAAGIELTGSAAQMARQGRRVDAAGLAPGDLVFFDTRGGPHTHVGIYIGEGRFIHAPSTASGRVRIARLDDSYFARRFTEARTYLD